MLESDRVVVLGPGGRLAGCGPPPDLCAHCGKEPDAKKKLLTCGRCKVAKYCNAACQKAHWGAGHKGTCKKCVNCIRLAASKRSPCTFELNGHRH